MCGRFWALVALAIFGGACAPDETKLRGGLAQLGDEDPRRHGFAVDDRGRLELLVLKDGRAEIATRTAAQLAQLARDADAVYPLEQPAGQVTPEGTGFMRLPDYHLGEPPARGAGIEVAVVDTGFAKSELLQRDGELPAELTRLRCEGESCSEVASFADPGSPHGSAAAEVLHDVAPEATLTLVQLASTLRPAHIDALVSRGVRVAVMPLALPPLQPMDGRDTLGLHSAFARARAAGLVFVVPAGNGRRRTWSGALNIDAGIHLFDDDTPRNRFALRAGETARLFLSWNEWAPGSVTQGVASSDLNLRVFGPDGESVALMGGSDLQDGDDLPIERASFTATESGLYEVEITGPAQPELELRLVLWASGTFAHFTPPRSLAFPGDGDAVLTVGSARPSDRALERDSGEGPTADDRPKPNLCAFGRASTASYGAHWAGWQDRRLAGDFDGTSAATAHAGGALALLFSTGQAPDSALRILEEAAVDRGVPGVDPRFGAGVLALPLRDLPQLTLDAPTSVATARAGTPDDPRRFVAELRVVSPGGVFVEGLLQRDFNATVGALPASIVAAWSDGERYRLSIAAPPQPAAGLYDLEVRVFIDKRSFGATQAQAVAYQNDALAVDTVLVIDRSSSMAGAALEAAQAAAIAFGEVVAEGDGLGLVSYADSASVDYPLTLVQRGAAAPVLSEDFENGAGAFDLTGGFGVEAGAGLGGSTALSDSPGGNYTARADASATLRMPLNAAGGRLTLELFSWLRSERNFDRGRIEARAPGGSWGELWRGSGIRPWEQLVIPLLQLPEQELRFRFTSDSSREDEGWHIDNLRVRPREPLDEFRDATAAIGASGSTSIGAGLSLALEELRQRSDATRKRAILLLSDGEESSGPYVREVLPSVIAEGVPVHTVALGDADQRLMESVAADTGGDFAIAPSARDLQRIYADLSGRIAGREVLIQEDFDLDAGASRQHEIVIDPSVRSAVIGVRWDDPEQGFGVALSAPMPGGERVETRGSNFVLFRLDAPPPGAWQVEVSRPAEAGAGEAWDYELEVQVDSPITLQLFLEPARPERARPIRLVAILAGLTPLTGAVVKAEITRPSAALDPAPRVVTLRDDGHGADAQAGDAVYTGIFDAARFAGSYSLELSAQLPPPAPSRARRVLRTEFEVAPAEDSDGDGMPDGWEWWQGLDPGSDDADLDTDADGSTNLAELRGDSDPREHDGLRSTIPAGSSGELARSPAILRFAEAGERRLQLFNAGGRFLDLTLALDDSDAFSLPGNVEFLRLGPGANATLRVAFAPVAAGDVRSTLHLRSGNGEWAVPLIASGPLTTPTPQPSTTPSVTPVASQDPTPEPTTDLPPVPTAPPTERPRKKSGGGCTSAEAPPVWALLLLFSLARRRRR